MIYKSQQRLIKPMQQSFAFFFLLLILQIIGSQALLFSNVTISVQTSKILETGSITVRAYIKGVQNTSTETYSYSPIPKGKLLYLNLSLKSMMIKTDPTGKKCYSTNINNVQNDSSLYQCQLYEDNYQICISFLQSYQVETAPNNYVEFMIPNVENPLFASNNELITFTEDISTSSASSVSQFVYFDGEEMPLAKMTQYLWGHNNTISSCTIEFQSYLTYQQSMVLLLQLQYENLSDDKSTELPGDPFVDEYENDLLDYYIVSPYKLQALSPPNPFKTYDSVIQQHTLTLSPISRLLNAYTYVYTLTGFDPQVQMKITGFGLQLSASENKKYNEICLDPILQTVMLSTPEDKDSLFIQIAKSTKTSLVLLPIIMVLASVISALIFTLCFGLLCCKFKTIKLLKDIMNVLQCKKCAEILQRKQDQLRDASRNQRDNSEEQRWIDIEKHRQSGNNPHLSDIMEENQKINRANLQKMLFRHKSQSGKSNAQKPQFNNQLQNHGLQEAVDGYISKPKPSAFIYQNEYEQRQNSFTQNIISNASPISKYQINKNKQGNPQFKQFNENLHNQVIEKHSSDQLIFDNDNKLQKQNKQKLVLQNTQLQSKNDYQESSPASLSSEFYRQNKNFEGTGEFDLPNNFKGNNNMQNQVMQVDHNTMNKQVVNSNCEDKGKKSYVRNDTQTEVRVLTETPGYEEDIIIKPSDLDQEGGEEMTNCYVMPDFDGNSKEMKKHSLMNTNANSRDNQMKAGLQQVFQQQQLLSKQIDPDQQLKLLNMQQVQLKQQLEESKKLLITDNLQINQQVIQVQKIDIQVNVNSSTTTTTQQVGNNYDIKTNDTKFSKYNDQISNKIDIEEIKIQVKRDNDENSKIEEDEADLQNDENDNNNNNAYDMSKKLVVPILTKDKDVYDNVKSNSYDLDTNIVGLKKFIAQQ
eukprot:403349514